MTEAHDGDGADDPTVYELAIASPDGRFRNASFPGDLGERRPSIFLERLEDVPIQVVHRTSAGLERDSADIVSQHLLTILPRYSNQHNSTASLFIVTLTLPPIHAIIWR